MLAGERLDLRNEPGMPAQRQLRIDSRLYGREPQLLQPLDLDTCERLELEIGERTSLPQRLRDPEGLGRTCGVASGQRLAAGADETLEVLEIELSGLDAQEVAGCARDEPGLVRAGGAEHLPKPRDVVAQRVVGRVHALLREELADQAFPRDDTVRAEKQQREQRALLRPPSRDRVSADPDCQRAENLELDLLICCHSPPGSLLRRNASAKSGRRPWDRLGTRPRDPRWVLYTAKCFWPGVTESEVRDALGGAARHRTPTCRGALLFTDDELVLCLFESGTREAVRSASVHLGIPCERVIDSVWIEPGGLKRRSLWEGS